MNGNSGATVRVASRGPLRGTLRVPGDKSVSHRALILAGLAFVAWSLMRPELGNTRTPATA